MVSESKNNDLVWMIGGEAGFGIQSAGHYFALSCARGGLNIFGNIEYPSLIRGGHNSTAIRVADFEVGIHKEDLNLLVAMNQETLDLHLKELVADGGVIYDGEVPVLNQVQDDINIYNVPLKRLAMEAGKGDITRNTVGIGASFALLEYDLEIYLNILREMFARKGELIVNNNVAAAQAGFDFIVKNYDVKKFPYKLRTVSETLTPGPSPRGRGEVKKIMITGNDMLCIGALKAGCKLVAEYPMTPTSSVLHLMAKEAKDFNLIVKHTEDELAAMNMAVGAGWAGVRSMTATSGGGFCLMTEALGMAGMIEAPVVVYEAQRGGPSTGLPTRTEQSDLRFALHASQGEFPRMVVAPSDFTEMFYDTFEAFNVAEKFQMPVIILGDKHLAESIRTVPEPDTSLLVLNRGELIRDEAEIEKLREAGFRTADDGFYRYKFTENGVSPRVLPGSKGGRHRAATDEHDESGDLTETEENRTAMHRKRMRKLEFCLNTLPAPELVGPGINGSLMAGPAFTPDEADLTFVSWGSPKEAILETIQILFKEGIKANLLVIKYLIPFHTEQIKKILSASKNLINVEMNYEGQLAALIAEKTGIFMNHSILKWSGQQFTADQIHQETKKIMESTKK